MIFRPGDRVSMKAGDQGARVMLLGGATMEGPRYIWWNFVASSRERIEEAKQAWRAGDWEMDGFNCPPAMMRNLFRCRTGSRLTPPAPMHRSTTPAETLAKQMRGCSSVG